MHGKFCSEKMAQACVNPAIFSKIHIAKSTLVRLWLYFFISVLAMPSFILLVYRITSNF